MDNAWPIRNNWLLGYDGGQMDKLYQYYIPLVIITIPDHHDKHSSIKSPLYQRPVSTFR